VEFAWLGYTATTSTRARITLDVLNPGSAVVRGFVTRPMPTLTGLPPNLSVIGVEPSAGHFCGDTFSACEAMGQQPVSFAPAQASTVQLMVTLRGILAADAVAAAQPRPTLHLLLASGEVVQVAQR
jgi:hypothetical protein